MIDELEDGTTAEDQIHARIREGARFVDRGIGLRDRTACKRFLDGSEAATDVQNYDYYVDLAGVLPSSMEPGNVNYLTINLLTKVAAIAIADPDFRITSDNPQSGELIRAFLRKLWKMKFWARVCRTALLKRSISGMGCVAYLWDENKGPLIEHVRVKDLAIDPNVTDWHNPRWAARRIRLPKEEAEERFPNVDFDALSPSSNQTIYSVDTDSTTALPSETVEMWVYWDKDQEVICYGSETIQEGPNLYGRVPLIFLEGDIAPESEFSIGDFDTAYGIQVQLARLQSIINNQAENGGAVLWYNTALDDQAKQAFLNGRPQGPVGINIEAADAFGYVSCEPMSEALMNAMAMAQKGLDSFTGVTEYQRGVINQNVKFATEAAMLANQSGSRGTMARIEYEQFLDEITRAILDMMVKFGAALADPNSPHDQEFFQSITSIQDIAVIERSTAYTDPAAEQQVSLQLLQVMMPFIQAGLVNPVPLIAKVFRAFGEQNIEQYLILQPAAPQGAPGAMSPGGDTAAAQQGAMPPGGGQLPPGGPVAVTGAENNGG